MKHSVKTNTCHVIGSAILIAALSACASGPDIPPKVTTTFETTKLDAPSANADLSAWLEWTRATHPDLSYTADLHAIEATVDEISSSFAAMDTLSAREAWAGMAKLNPALADAHLGLRLPDAMFNKYVETGGAQFPAPVRVSQGKVFVAETVAEGGALTAGDEIISVNDVKMSDMLDWFSSRIRGEDATIREIILSSRFPLALWTYYGGAPTYVAAIKPKRGPAKRVTLDPQRDVADQNSLDPFRLRFIDDVAVLDVDTFVREQETAFATFLETAFAEIAEKAPSTLLIDIRDNGGGARELSNMLMSYLTDRPFSPTSTVTARIVPQNQGLVPGSEVGQVLTLPFPQTVTPPDDLPNRFTGEIIVVIGPRTYSQAIVFAATAKDNGVAALAGLPTSGLANQTGQVTRNLLPHTGFTVQSPIYILYRASGEKSAAPLTPDITVEGRGDAPLKKFIDGERASSSNPE